MNKFYIPLFAVLFFAQNLVAQTDTLPPYLRCKGLINMPASSHCVTTIWAPNLIDSVSDNTPGPLQLGIRKVCTGNGFPENRTHVVYISRELGPAQAEIWARDSAGNTASCVVNLLIIDYAQSCDPIADIQVNRPDQTGIGGVRVSISGQNCLGDTIPSTLSADIETANNGRWMKYGTLLKTGFTSVLTPSKKSAPLNGVSSLDLTKIQRHILGIEPFDAPWKIIAADANLDGKVTLQDVVLLQKLLLGHISKLPHGQSWRFYPQNHIFQDPANPFQPTLPNAIVVPNTVDPVMDWFEFYGVKIGDVNGNAAPGL